MLGPLVMKRHYQGATTWALLLASFSVGLIVGGVVALRFRPRRPLLASCLTATPVLLQPLGVGLQLPTSLLVLIAVVAGVGIAVHLALWFTTFQRNVPKEVLSRVSSYDALGSFVLLPLGSAVAGPVSTLIGVRQTLIGSSLVEAACFAIIVAQPSVRAIRDRAPAGTDDPAPQLG